MFSDNGKTRWPERYISSPVLMLIILSASAALASLQTYDQAIEEDQAAGYSPAARLTAPVALTGSNKASFNFGKTSGDVTIEFILEGDPVAGSGSKYLAVGSNSQSNLRYEQWSNTGQLGFTELGVLDYLFLPAIPSPTHPVHIAYVWDDSKNTMTLYMNGTMAGSRSGVTPSFAMPTGQGYLGAHPNTGEGMIGTLHRVTVYNEIVDDAVILEHADRYNDVAHPPVVSFFYAEPEAVFSPGSSTLQWFVEDAILITLNGLDVTDTTQLTVMPTHTTTYTLFASNDGGDVSAQTTIQVDPGPVIDQFKSDKMFAGPGETVTLHWETRYAEAYLLTPGQGDMTPFTTHGTGSFEVQVQASTTFTLMASNAFDTATAETSIQIVNPATHLVISEFMADDDATLADEDGDFTGWIEIHNPTQTSINLAGHYLTDDDRTPVKWALPNLDLAADGYLVVFASGKDRTDLGQPLHANFRLNNDGEPLALVGPGPAIVHAFTPAYPSQANDISYGLLGGDIHIELFMGQPTPGTENDATPPPPQPVRFSFASGMFTQAFFVTLTHDEPASTIFYTLDGSTPDEVNGQVYTTPLSIEGTTQLRAVAVVEGQVSPVKGEHYVRMDQDLALYSSSLPILVIDNFGSGMIPQKGWSGSGAGVRQLPRQDAIWATFDRVNGKSAFANAPQMFSRIGIRGRGAFSTQWRQKPYSVEAVDENNEEQDVAPLDLPPHSDWILYFPDPDDNKDPTLLFNTFVYGLSGNTDRYSVRFRWVEAFINEDGGNLNLADRRGVYALIEKVSRGTHRLDFERLSKDGSSGSWLLNINRIDAEPDTGWPAINGATRPWYFHTAGANRLQQTPANSPGQGDDIPRQGNGFLNFDNPNGYVINSTQRAAIENWFIDFEDVLYDNTLWKDPALGYRHYLDDLDFIDYFILNVLTKNGDGMLISMFPWKGDDGKLRMGPAWDYNWSSYYISGSPTTSLMHRSDRLWYGRLFSDPDFKQRYIDRWWALRAGPMSNEGILSVIDDQMADISPAKALLNGLASESEWLTRLQRMKDWLTTRADWIDRNYLAPPIFNHIGGAVPTGFEVVVQGETGTLYVTIDGQDPRASGGGLSPSALMYKAPIPIHTQMQVQARIRKGNQWSGLALVDFFPPQNLDALKITEIMFNPIGFGAWNGEELEFLELKNTGTIDLNLGGLTFTSGIEFTFPNGTLLGPGEFFVLGRNTSAFESLYPGFSLNGLYTGKLANNGETLTLSTPFGQTILSLTYDDQSPWPMTPDGHGFSLVPKEPSIKPGDQGSLWRASTLKNGSPGHDDPLPGSLEK